VLARAESARSALRWNQRTKSMLPQLLEHLASQRRPARLARALKAESRAKIGGRAENPLADGSRMAF
jgi:hypothetical protein